MMIQTIEQQIEQLVRKVIQDKRKRRKLVVANWKMNMTAHTAIPLLAQISQISYQHQVIICPPFPLLYPVKDLLEKLKSTMSLGAQNVHTEEKGAHTGEVSGFMLADIGCQYVIIGHSERRIAGETEDMVQRKVKQALSHGLQPIICVGETKNEREQGRANEVIQKQVKSALQNVSSMTSIVIAYEPVWAIGSGESAEPEQIQDMHQEIRSTLIESYGEVADCVPMLYGGSVKADNAERLSQIDDVDGALVGGASLDADAFKGIIQAFV
jgi:triosephosphate isomerase